MSVRRFHDVGHNVNSVNYVNIDAVTRINCIIETISNVYLSVLF